MKANELRLGNLVSVDNEVYHPSLKDKSLRIIGINGGGRDSINLLHVNGMFEQECSQCIEFLKPIPLTEEWLVKFGFGFRQDDISKMFHVGENPLTYDWLFCVTWIDGYQFPFYKNGYHEIKHVHQLQNLYFAITGEELTVKELA